MIITRRSQNSTAKREISGGPTGQLLSSRDLKQQRLWGLPMMV